MTPTDSLEVKKEPTIAEKLTNAVHAAAKSWPPCGFGGSNLVDVLWRAGGVGRVTQDHPSAGRIPTGCTYRSVPERHCGAATAQPCRMLPAARGPVNENLGRIGGPPNLRQNRFSM
jgi:hypothetical protein